MSIMDKLQLPHAKLLYYVSELFKQKEIDNQEKLSLKEMVISDEPKVFELLDFYQANQNISELKNGLIMLVRPEMAEQLLQQQKQQDREKQDEQDNNNNNNEEEDEEEYSEYSDDNMIEEQAKMEDPTSPLGNQLFKKKRQRPNGAQHYQDILQPMPEQKSAEKK